MILIEQASLADAATLARLNLHVHRLHIENAARFFLEPSDDDRLAAFGELLSQANARAFIAYADDTPVGYVLALIQERAGSAFNPARRWLDVDQISVEPEWKGRGIGRQLMKMVVEYARSAGIDELETSTWAFNDKAQRFFKGLGFQPKNVRFWMQLDK